MKLFKMWSSIWLLTWEEMM